MFIKIMVIFFGGGGGGLNLFEDTNISCMQEKPRF